MNSSPRAVLCIQSPYHTREKSLFWKLHFKFAFMQTIWIKCDIFCIAFPYKSSENGQNRQHMNMIRSQFVHMAIEGHISHWGSINDITKFMRIPLDQYVNNLSLHNKLYAIRTSYTIRAAVIVVIILFIAIEWHVNYTRQRTVKYPHIYI